MTKALVLTAILLGVVLAGCSGKTSSTDNVDTVVTSRPALDAGKGAITGLLIDDVYRPVPNGLVLLQGSGLTATTDDLGQFSFVNLEPGSYVALATAANHEAAPINVDVKAGEYSDLEIQARRIFSQDGSTVTLQSSVFIPCAVSSPAITVTVNCLGDLSGDSYRTGFTTNFTGDQITWLVAEVRFNKVDNYQFVLRPDGTTSEGDAYNYTIIHQGDYGKVLLQAGENSTWNQNKWKPGDRMQATIFYSGQTDCTKSPAPGTVPDPDSCNGFGAGGTAGIKATMLLTAFVGEPGVDVLTYAVMAPPPT